MQTLENDSTAVASVEIDSDAIQGSYDVVRSNAMKHGIPSRLVLAHGDQAEFSDLQAALLDEHQPAGITEQHLIDELATIIWPKQRVLLAEGAKINAGLDITLSNSQSLRPGAIGWPGLARMRKVQPR